MSQDSGGRCDQAVHMRDKGEVVVLSCWVCLGPERTCRRFESSKRKSPRKDKVCDGDS
jgi:hypothetical protein